MGVNRNSTYVNGTAAPEIIVPGRQTEIPVAPQTNDDKKREARKKAARRNRQRALYMGRGTVLFYTMCALVVALLAVTYVKIQADITHRMKHIAAVESQISDLRADNDANYKRIVTSVDMNEVKNIAMNELGMHYATEDQVVYYVVEKTNYMDQYEVIPVK